MIEYIKVTAEIRRPDKQRDCYFMDWPDEHFKIVLLFTKHTLIVLICRTLKAPGHLMRYAVVKVRFIKGYHGTERVPCSQS